MNGSNTLSSSPRQRRLTSDHQRLKSLALESSIFSFEVAHPRPAVGPPETYRVRFRGAGLQLVSSRHDGDVVPLNDHEVLIQLVAEYPRSAPHMRWMTPIFHPNISASGAICLGGWGTHWAPSLQLDRLCEMLWDMLRFANYDTRSPFNQQAAVWLRKQRQYHFPLDNRELRDRPALVTASLVAPPAPEAPSMHFDSPILHHPPRTPLSTDPFGQNLHREPHPNHNSEVHSPPAQPDILFLD